MKWQMLESAKVKRSQEIVDSMNQSEVGQGVIAVGAKVKSQGLERVTLSGLNTKTVIETPDHPDNPLDSWLVYYTAAGKNYGHAWFKTLPEVWRYIWERNLELTLPIPVGKRKYDIPDVVREIGIKPEDKLSCQEIRTKFISDLSGQDLDPDEILNSPELRDLKKSMEVDGVRPRIPWIELKKHPGGVIAQVEWGRYWLGGMLKDIFRKYLPTYSFASFPRIAPKDSHGRNTGMSPEKVLLTTDTKSSITDLKRAAKTKYVIRGKKEDIPGMLRDHIQNVLFKSFEVTPDSEKRTGVVGKTVELALGFAEAVADYIRTEPDILKKIEIPEIEAFLDREFNKSATASMLQVLTPPDLRIKGFQISESARREIAAFLLDLLGNEDTRKDVMKFLDELTPEHLRDISDDLYKEHRLLSKARDLIL